MAAAAAAAAATLVAFHVNVLIVTAVLLHRSNAAHCDVTVAASFLCALTGNSVNFRCCCRTRAHANTKSCNNIFTTKSC